MTMQTDFDDFLGLAARDFSRHRLVVFVGRSGSGKSTAIGFVRQRHPAFEVMDELRRLADLERLRAPLQRGARMLVASHVAAGWFLALRPFMRVAVFRTDRDEGKIARYLHGRRIAASAPAVAAYVRRFGATYTDVDLILERFPSASFDASLRLFTRFCSLRSV